LIGQYLCRETLLIVPVTNVLELLLGQLQQLGFFRYSDIDVHDILHKEGSLVDDRSLVKLFKDEVILFKLGEDLNDTLL